MLFNTHLQPVHRYGLSPKGLLNSSQNGFGPMRHGALKHRYLHLAQRAPRSNAMSGPKPLLPVQLMLYRLQTFRSLFISANSRQLRVHGYIVRICNAAVSPLRYLPTPVEGAFLNTPHLGGFTPDLINTRDMTRVSSSTSAQHAHRLGLNLLARARGSKADGRRLGQHCRLSQPTHPPPC